jgi:UPF0755 protein
VVGPPLLIGAVLALWGRRRQTLSITLVLFSGILLAGFTSMFAAGVFWGPAPEPLPQPITIVIEAGTGTHGLAEQLAAEGVISDAETLIRAARLTGMDRALQAGRYHFPGGESMLGVLARLSNGGTLDELVTIPEGLRATQVAAIVAREAEVDSATFMQLLTDPEFIQSTLGVDPDLSGEGHPQMETLDGYLLPETLDGYLLPETYNIYYQMPAEEVVRLMVRHFTDLWSEALAGSAERLGMSRREVVTLASIIEREAVAADEREIISSVFHNRMERGMRLESCATVLYALGRYKPRLYERDLQVDSPYNTYRHQGLPPGPIANPGAASLIASVNPAADSYLYFVARGDGTHIFSRTFQEHVNAKNASGEGVLVGGKAAREAAGKGDPGGDPGRDPGRQTP